MKGFYIVSFLLGIFLLFGCSAEKQADVQMAPPTKAHTKIMGTAFRLTTHLDPVCGMDMRKHTITDTTIYKDQLYGFCGSHCKEKFLEDPEAAIAKLELEK